MHCVSDAVITSALGFCDALEAPTILCTGDDRVLQQPNRSAKGWQMNDGNTQSQAVVMLIPFQAILSATVSVSMKHTENGRNS